MATAISTTAITNNQTMYVANNQLADAEMLIASAMRLIEKTDGEANCLLTKAMVEIVAAQDYLEELDPLEAPISDDVAAMPDRICRNP
ncbi:MAG: hypothetical protein FIB06_09470 [Betaproteobacteria bacterium]|nr:hypothetical protein [Betaproteobacteria bacterium]